MNSEKLATPPSESQLTDSWPTLQKDSSSPLYGMRVLDLSEQLPGPYATLLLASLGATVIKIESPKGDAARTIDPIMFENINAGKTSLTLDLKIQSDRFRLYELLSDADVFIEGYRPGVTERLGCDYVTLKERKEKLIYCSISGFGQTGPLSSRPTHDISLQAMAGALQPGVRVDRIGVPWVDLATGTSAALAITAAWHQGSGAYLDMSMLDSAVAWASVKPAAVRELEPTYGTVVTADQQHMVIALLEDSMWQRLCIALSWDDWAQDRAFATYLERRGLAQKIRTRLDVTLGQLSSERVQELAKLHDLPIGLVDESADPDTQTQLSSRFTQGGSPWRGCVPLPESLLQPLASAPELNLPNQDSSIELK